MFERRLREEKHRHRVYKIATKGRLGLEFRGELRAEKPILHKYLIDRSEAIHCQASQAAADRISHEQSTG
jgi:hypothetical protein